jgi:hypothetical protein
MLTVQSKTMTELVKDTPTMLFAGRPCIYKHEEHHRIPSAYFSACSNRAAGPIPLECNSYVDTVFVSLLESNIDEILPYVTKSKEFKLLGVGAPLVERLFVLKGPLLPPLPLAPEPFPASFSTFSFTSSLSRFRMVVRTVRF